MMDLSNTNLRSTFGDFLQYFKDLDFEAFLIMKPPHIKEQTQKNTAPLHEIDGSIETDIDLDGDLDQITDEMLESLNKDIPKINEVMLPSSQKEKTYLKTAKDILNIPSIDLKLVVNRYIEKKEPLENCDRIVIAKEIVHYLLVNDFERQIERPEFIRLSNIIVEIFPTEDKGTYYLPSHKNAAAQGKLYAAYSNYRTLFRNASLCRKRQYIPKRNNEGICDPEKTIEEPNESDEIALKNTFENSENLELIRKFWQTSYHDRKKLLLEMNTNKYLKKFPAFDLYNGYALFILDADKIIGQRRSKLPEIAQKILIFAKRQKRPSQEIKKILIEFEQFSQHLDENALIDFKQLTALKLLPFLMAKTTKKLSKSEASSYFIPYYKTALEADTFKNKYFKTDELFPRLLLVGDIIKPSANIYVSDKHYVIDNPVTGFEVLFRAFLSLNCKFPVQSQHIWEFVQKMIFDLPSGSMKRVASTETFMQHIRNISIN